MGRYVGGTKGVVREGYALFLNNLFLRMLDEHFEDQMNEIIKLCPVKRQTMLFSATMTDKVREE